MRLFRNVKRAAGFAAAALLLGAPAEAYYHYVYYVNSSGAVQQRVGARQVRSQPDCPNSTLTFYVSDTGPANLGARRQFWLRARRSEAGRGSLECGAHLGTAHLFRRHRKRQSERQHSRRPGNLSGPAPRNPRHGYAQHFGPHQFLQGPYPARLFVPITHSLVMLTNNTNSGSSSPGPSYLESYFTTAVHEIGHSLGLQHTWTGSAMSQAVIRDTSRARPLDADDIASLSESVRQRRLDVELRQHLGHGAVQQRPAGVDGVGSGDRAHRRRCQRPDQPRRHLHHQRPAAQHLSALRAPAAARCHRQR